VARGILAPPGDHEARRLYAAAPPPRDKEARRLRRAAAGGLNGKALLAAAVAGLLPTGEIPRNGSKFGIYALPTGEIPRYGVKFGVPALVNRANVSNLAFL